MGGAQASLGCLARPPAGARSAEHAPGAGDSRLAGEHRNGPRHRNLARFERKFEKYGLRTIEQLPVDQLRRALREFEALVRNWSSASLADLRSRMAVVLADRSSAASVWIAINTVNGAHRHGPGVASRLLAGTGSASRAGVQRSGSRVGMSRFNWADGGFNSTSAPA